MIKQKALCVMQLFGLTHSQLKFYQLNFVFADKMRTCNRYKVQGDWVELSNNVALLWSFLYSSKRKTRSSGYDNKAKLPQ